MHRTSQLLHSVYEAECPNGQWVEGTFSRAILDRMAATSSLRRDRLSMSNSLKKHLVSKKISVVFLKFVIVDFKSITILLEVQ